MAFCPEWTHTCHLNSICKITNSFLITYTRIECGALWYRFKSQWQVKGKKRPNERIIQRRHPNLKMPTKTVENFLLKVQKILSFQFEVPKMLKMSNSENRIFENFHPNLLKMLKLSWKLEFTKLVECSYKIRGTGGRGLIFLLRFLHSVSKVIIQFQKHHSQKPKASEKFKLCERQHW